MTRKNTERLIELQPITESSVAYEKLEARIKAAFMRLLYAPLVRELELSSKTKGPIRFRNISRKGALLSAIAKGRITPDFGASLVFSGKFDADVSAYLRSIGAEWDRRLGVFTLKSSLAPAGLKNEITKAAGEFAAKLRGIDRRLQKKLPEEFAEAVKSVDLFSSRLEETNKHLQRTLKKITVLPELSPEVREKIAVEWQTNLDIWIKDFTAEEIVKLRTDIQAAVTAGNRHAALVSAIKKSYGVTEAKAKFLARQETSLLMTKFKESRYTEAGITKYRWGCVAGSKGHPVRPSHKILEGKVFSWNDPPITTPPGEATRRNNPGQDFNCRCFAKPIVQFRESTE